MNNTIGSEETTVEQKALVERADRMIEILNEAPKMALNQFIRVTEQGIIPDVRLVIVKHKKDGEQESNTGDEGQSEQSTGGVTEESGSEQPTESPSTGG